MLNIYFLILVLLFLACNTVEKSGKTRTMPEHHTENGFRNPHNDEQRGFGDFLKWQFGRGPQESPPIPREEIPPYKPQYSDANLNHIHHPDSSEIQVTWIGHATFLIQIAGINILTDPIFSERCSPVSFAGPERFARPGIKFEDLPEIHAVVISHNHYDHLDAPTIEMLGNKPKYFVPLGIAKWLREKEISNAVELDWWQSQSYAGLNFHSAPVQHFSGRSPFDRNETLWTGWVIESPAGRVFFAGDTGYSPDFKEIGVRFGPIQVAMIPIGAYRPRWFMGPVHVDPPQAIKIHEDVQAQTSLAMHWGTFKLADEPLGEPPVYLKQALKAAGISDDKFIVMKFGQTLAF